MNLGISHLVFADNIQLREMCTGIKNLGISNLEVVFSKFKNENELPNIPTLSTQSILYNSNIADLLDKKFLPYMELFIEKCCAVGVHTLVLGSPSCRNVLDFEKLIQQFTALDNMLRIKELILCIEPNAKKYRGKYFHTVEEIAAFINVGNFTNIKSMIDTHNLLQEQEDIIDTLNKHTDIIAHIHISENNLEPLKQSQLHFDFAYELKKVKYNKLVTYEALNLTDITESIKIFRDIYGN